MKFVVSHLDQQMGPFDEQELKMKWAAGEILPIDYVFDDAKQDWILLAERFPWAAKPLVKETTGGGPPPVKEGHIMKRMPPPPRANGAANGVAAAAPSPGPAPTPAGTTVVSAKEVTHHAMNISEGLKLSEPLKIEPIKTTVFEPIKTTEILKLANTRYDEEKPDLVPPTTQVTEVSLPSTPIHHNMPIVQTPVAAPIAQATPSITQAPIHSAVTATVPTGAKVNMVNGVGELELPPVKPGEVNLLVQGGATLRQTEPLKINVKASEPVVVEWTVPAQQTVGQDVEVLIRAMDNRGMVCAHYNDEYLLTIRGPVSQDIPVKIVEGKALVMLNHIKAESWNLTLQYNGARALRMPEGRQLEWLPGAAARLVLDGNHEFLAGDPMKVQLRAVDAYGNTARTFQGQVVLEVKAS